jgi:phage internal scaffolding protein
MKSSRVKTRDADGKPTAWYSAIQQPKNYDNMTKQSFKDATDVNKILAKHSITGSLSHLEKYEGTYGDFSDFDFLEAQNQIARGKQIFEELPAEVRREFGNNPGAFFEFANDPANVGKLEKVLPKIAERGNFFPRVNGEAVREPPSEPVASVQSPAEGTPSAETEVALEGDSGAQSA